jgi:hypothetical protein
LDIVEEVATVCLGAGWAVSGRITAHNATSPNAITAATMNLRMTGLSYLLPEALRRRFARHL